MSCISCYHMGYLKSTVPNLCGLAARLGRERGTGPDKCMYTQPFHEWKAVHTCASAYWPTSRISWAAHVHMHTLRPATHMAQFWIDHSLVVGWGPGIGDPCFKQSTVWLDCYCSAEPKLFQKHCYKEKLPFISVFSSPVQNCYYSSSLRPKILCAKEFHQQPYNYLPPWVNVYTSLKEIPLPWLSRNFLRASVALFLQSCFIFVT